MVSIPGINDHTICFYCCVSLKDREVSDSVWQEHSTWSPKRICYLPQSHWIRFKHCASLKKCSRLL